LKISRFGLVSFLIACSIFPASNVYGKDDLGRRLAEADALSHNGHYIEARQIVQSILRKYPREKEAYIILGNSYLNMDDNGESLGRKGYKQAVESFEKARAIDPEYGKTYDNLAECAVMNGDYKEAVVLSTKALTVKQPCYSGYRQRCIAYEALGKYDLAIKDIDAYLKKGSFNLSDQVKYQMLKAGILENARRFDEALAIYKNCESLQNDDTVKLRMIGCLRKAGRARDAIGVTNAMLKANSEDEFALQLRAKLKVEAGDLKGAIDDYSRAIDSLPTASLLNERAALYDKTGRSDLAKKDRKRASGL